MTEDGSVGTWETPRIEVRVYRLGDLVHRELCDSEEDAREVVEVWSEHENVRCEVDDLTTRHHPDDVLAPEPALPLDDDDT